MPKGSLLDADLASKGVPFARRLTVPMTERQRGALLALPATEDEVVRHHSLGPDDLAAIAEARTPANRLGYALQLCCLRYPGRHLRHGETLPAIMLDHHAGCCQSNRHLSPLSAGIPNRSCA